MSNNLVIPDDGGWDSIPTTPRGVVKGALLKFNQNGEYLRDGDEDVAGLRVVPTGVKHGWLRFTEDGKPDYRLNAPGKPEIEREDLGDLDEKRWKANKWGDRPDPWQQVKLAFFIDPVSGEEFTFSTSTSGGFWAVDDLVDLMRRSRRAMPGASPIVELTSTSFKNNRGGMTAWPVFRMTGEWVFGNGEPAPAPDLDNVALPPPTQAPERPRGKATIESGRTKAEPVASSVNPLDDDIPF